MKKQTSKDYYEKQCLKIGPVALLMAMGFLEHFEEYEECQKIKAGVVKTSPEISTTHDIITLGKLIRKYYNHAIDKMEVEHDPDMFTSFSSGVFQNGFDMMSEVYGEKEVAEMAERYADEVLAGEMWRAGR